MEELSAKKVSEHLGFCWISDLAQRESFLESNSTFVPYFLFIFFYLGFLSRTFTIHRTAGEGEGYLFYSSLPLPPASQILRH